MRVLFAVSAAKNFVIMTADTTNAYQQSPLPSQQCYLMIDDAYNSWYRKHYSINVDPKTHVIPLERALQGHPKAGALWEKMIVAWCPGKRRTEIQVNNT
jgi:hypothetical protein